jgi:hypothetical protein
MPGPVSRTATVNDPLAEKPLIDTSPLGGTGPGGCVTLRNHDWCGQVSSAGHAGPMWMMSHELFHSLGLDTDIYGADGWRNAGCSIMASRLCHLDPWHKMLLGWAEPHLVALGAVQEFYLRPPILGLSNHALLLYDPTHSDDTEFYMAEYRSSSHGTYDVEVWQSGLMLWQIGFDSSKNLYILPPEPMSSHPIVGPDDPSIHVVPPPNFRPRGESGVTEYEAKNA